MRATKLRLRITGPGAVFLVDFNTELRQWVDVADQRVHGTTGNKYWRAGIVDQFSMLLPNGRTPYPHIDDEAPKMARDGYVRWQYPGKEDWVCEQRVEEEANLTASASVRVVESGKIGSLTRRSIGLQGCRMRMNLNLAVMGDLIHRAGVRIIGARLTALHL